jgi:hypothetical protein
MPEAGRDAGYSRRLAERAGSVLVLAGLSGAVGLSGDVWLARELPWHRQR